MLKHALGDKFVGKMSYMIYVVVGIDNNNIVIRNIVTGNLVMLKDKLLFKACIMRK